MPRGSLTDLELHGILWNVKPVTIRPQVFPVPVALVSHVHYSPNSVSSNCLISELWGGSGDTGVQSALLSWRSPLLSFQELYLTSL